jgi:hypothetical protein
VRIWASGPARAELLAHHSSGEPARSGAGGLLRALWHLLCAATRRTSPSPERYERWFFEALRSELLNTRGASLRT